MPQCLPCQLSQLPAEKGMGVWNSDTLLSSSSYNQNCLSACPALPARVRKSKSPGAGRGTIISLTLSALCPAAAPHIRLQLLARSLCISPSFPRSGLPDSWVDLCSPRRESVRRSCRWPRPREATVATWKTSLTLRSEDREEHSTYDTAPTCLASTVPWKRRGWVEITGLSLYCRKGREGCGLGVEGQSWGRIKG